MTSTFRIGITCSLTILTIAGCGESEVKTTATAPPVARAVISDEPEVILPSELRRKMKANENAKFQKVGNDIVAAELFQSGVKSIEALRGLPLRVLDLGMTEVTDLSPIEGMDLKTLILENTAIDSLDSIKGMQLEVLKIQNTKITDLSMIEGMPIRELNLLAIPIDDLTTVATLPLETLWVPQTNITDISPLQGKPMVSLDIQGTKVDSIQALTGMTTLKRLNISDTPVTDLTPLQGIKLEGITLSPENIKTGIEVLRSMPTLNTVVTSPQNPRQSAGEFWRAYDAGAWTEEPPEEKPAAATPEETKDAKENFDKLLNDSEKEAPEESDSQPKTEQQPSTDDAEKAGENSTNDEKPDESVEIK